jgi:RNA polymerase sigma-70 factor (ECF subfamily)
MDRDRSTPAELFQAAFDRLPDEFREALDLIRVEGLSYEDAAARLGIATTEVERRVSGALARLDRDVERLKWHEWRRWG